MSGAFRMSAGAVRSGRQREAQTAEYEEIPVAEWQAAQKHSKYNAKRTTEGGLPFDSLAEAERYRELKLLADAGDITDLVVHPRYELVARSQHGRALFYIADFAYTEGTQRIVEDVKGVQTQVFRLKARLFRELYPQLVLRIVER
jgi:hypothetical protein